MKTVQIRNVSESVHRALKARAALAGMSLSEYALKQLRDALEKPTRAELAARIRQRQRVELCEDPADLIRQERDRP